MPISLSVRWVSRPVGFGTPASQQAHAVVRLLPPCSFSNILTRSQISACRLDLGALLLLAGLCADDPTSKSTGPQQRARGRRRGADAAMSGHAPIPIGYLKEVYEHPRPSSRLDVDPSDAGVAGAKMAIDENNAGGKFPGDFYSLDVQTVASPEEAVAALAEALRQRTPYFHRRRLGRHPAQAFRLRRKTRTFSSSTFAPPTFRSGRKIAAPTSCIWCRTATCLRTRSRNISSTRNGPTGSWCTARPRPTSPMPMRSSAPPQRFGANIVDTREYKDVSGGKRDDIGVIPPGKQASLRWLGECGGRRLSDHRRRRRRSSVRARSCPIVAGRDLVPVAGTTGLIATTWSPGHEKWGATQANNQFREGLSSG